MRTAAAGVPKDVVETSHNAQPFAQVTWAPRYYMLDGWRGLAALGVASVHSGVQLFFSLGHFCVILFFVISGYCIAASAEICRANHVSPRGYMWRRMRRIYPPYFLAICVFTVTRLIKYRLALGNQLSHSPSVWFQNLTLTQWVSLLFHPSSYAWENPRLFVAAFWSLNYEEQFYLVIGVMLFAAISFKKDMIVGIVALLAVAIAWDIFHPSVSYGFFIEYWVEFAIGCLVFYRLCRTLDRRRRIAIDCALLLLIGVPLFLGTTLPVDDHRSAFSEWMVASGFALVLIYLRPYDAKFRVSKLGLILGALGAITYSLYLTNQFNERISISFARMLVHIGVPSMLDTPMRLFCLCALATAFWYVCERPFLNKPLKGSFRRPSPSTVESAAPSIPQ